MLTSNVITASLRSSLLYDCWGPQAWNTENIWAWRACHAFDSTTIDRCQSVLERAKFRKHKGGIKMHTLYDVEAQVPAFVHITEVKVHDSKALPEISYEKGAHYIFDRGYNDFGNLYTINRIEAFFVVRAKPMYDSSSKRGNGDSPRMLSRMLSATLRFIKAQKITLKNSVK